MSVNDEINSLINNKKIAVLGMGITNQAVIKELLSDVNDLIIIDDYFEQKEFLNYKLFKTKDVLDTDFDILIKSPGIRYDNGVILRNPQANIINDIELSYYIAKSRDIKIIAITGTNGKTSTTTLMTTVLNKAGFKAFSCGNIGISPLQVLLNETEIDYLVMELSSFQLKAINKFQAYAAFFLNFTPDHLDYHVTQQDYFESKLNIIKNTPTLECLFTNLTIDIPIKIVNATDTFDFDPKKINRGINIANIGLIAQFLEMEAIDKTYLNDVLVNDFKGLEHRIEFVAIIDGVSYYNDSKATNVMASSLALNSFKNIVLIAGGYDKKEDFSSLLDYLKNVKHICAYGQNKKNFLIFDETSLCDDLEQAVIRAKKVAKKGDVILLSPCSASYDQFKNYEERGRMFKSLVMGDL